MEVVNVISPERISERFIEQVHAVPVPQIQEQILEVAEITPQRRIPERIVEHARDVPVPQTREQTVGVVKNIPQERISERTAEQTFISADTVHRQGCCRAYCDTATGPSVSDCAKDGGSSSASKRKREKKERGGEGGREGERESESESEDGGLRVRLPRFLFEMQWGTKVWDDPLPARIAYTH